MKHSFYNLTSQHLFKVFAIFGFLLCVATITPFLPPPGIDSASPIQPYLNGVFSNSTPGGGSGNWEVELAYPNLIFTDPLSMLELPDRSGFYIAGKPGFIWKISNNPSTTQKTTVLDFSNVVDTDGDAGLMNAILHPEFGQAGSPNRGYIYVLYRYHPNGNQGNCDDDAMIRLSRFNKPDGSENFDRNSEYVHIQIFDTQCWHNGGGMFFDEEKYLYLTIGDAGGANDQFNTTQQIDRTLLGGLFRIDLSQNPNRSHPIRRQPIDPADKPANLPNSFTQGYYIPNDNPWLDVNGGILEEFYSVGLRSPHRATYDQQSGQIWIGDVGQGAREEITMALKGSNLQWPYKEGTINGPKAKPSPLIGTDLGPVFDYSHSVGNSVIGGFVYRGSKFASSLGGKYLFGDHGVRNVWTIDPNNGEVVFLVNIPAFGVGSKSGISSFATDANGEVYILKLFGTDQDGGRIYKLKQDNTVPDPPQFLSQTGAFSNLSTLTPASGIIPYTVNTPLWTDGAAKKRWVAIPNDGTHNTSAEQITFSANAEWQFPPGTVFIKHFELPINGANPAITARIETRFVVITADGGAYGVTYKWNDAGTDAELLTNGATKTFTVTRANGSQYTQEWTYPSRTDCMTCHNPNAGFVLGVKTRQLNGNFTYPSGITDNQLNTWQSLGLFSNTFSPLEINNFPKLVPLTDNSASLETKVKSYLDANCAHCHRPNGVEGVFDARFSTPLANQNLVNSIGISRNTPAGNVIVKPKDPNHSELWVRDNSLGSNAMPPLGKGIIDDHYISVLTDWINSLEETSCTVTYLSDLAWDGTPTNGWGPVELDQSNGETGAGDGTTLNINGVSFAKGLGTHANSEIFYNLNGQYDFFKAFIGVDDETCASGSVQFEVYTDGTLAYQSPVLTQADNALPVTVAVNGVNQLRLVVNDGGSGGTNPIACDHADWADAKLESCVTTKCDDLGLFTNTADIGAVQTVGQACFENGTYTIGGSGADIWGTNDEFRYVYTSQNSDLALIGRVNSVDNTNPWAKAGLMIRADNSSNAPFALLLQRPDKQVGFQWRTAAGLGATWTGSLAGGTASPKFLRLTRNGAIFKAFYSTTSSNGPWTQIGGDVSIAMTDDVLVGLAVTSHNDGTLCNATFDQVRIEGCLLAPGTACNDNDPCTNNDVYDVNCNCAGTYTDKDEDGYCAGEDPDDNDACIPNATGGDCNPCSVINFSDFESGWGIWIDGGSNCTRSTTNPASGIYSARIRDNTGVSSSFYTNSLNLSSYNQIEISFSYITSSMDNSTEDFWLQISTDGGSNYSTYEEWNLGDEFQNGIRYFESVVFNDINFSANTRFRFMCDASNTGDLVYIDNVEIKGCTSTPPPSCTPGTPCDDGISCTINDVYGADCNCAGQIQDQDNDSICDPDDVCPGFDDRLIGTPCDDADFCTVNDIYTVDCGCAGVYQDNDNDGLCIGEDPDDTNPCVPNDLDGNCGDCLTIDETDFEAGWGIWNDGGIDCRRNINDAAYANSGSYCIRLQDNTGAAAAMFTDNLNLSGFSSVEFSFSYITVSMDNPNEDFWLQVSTDGGSSFSTYEEWNLNDEFVNNVRYEETVLISGITFSNQTRFRLVCDASSNGDYVYIDDVRIKGCGGNQALVEQPQAEQIAPIPVDILNVTKTFKEEAIDLNILVKPNPFREEVRLYIDQPSPSMKRATLRVMDVSGRIIYQRFDVPFDEEFVIPTHQGWTPGVYFIRVQASHLMKTVRVVKQ